MGSPSLMIVLILVVWIIVLAPLAVGNSKPIRRSGEGYEETRVLHEGGTAPMPTRRRPKLTAADIHRHGEEDDYELVEAVGEEQVLIDDAPALRIFPQREHAADEPAEAPEHIDGEVIEHVEDEVNDEVEVEADATADDASIDADVAAAASSGSTAISVLQDTELEQGLEDEQERYDLEESYAGPEDYGYAANEPEADGDAVDEAAVADAETEEGLEDVDGEVLDADAEADADADAEADPEAEGGVEADEDDLAFAAARRGRGGYDPERELTTTATRFQRRQRTLLALIAACVVTFVVAFVAGGWTWALPAIAVGLTVWFMVALRRVVLQERALRERRLRQLRRARLGVVTAESEQVRRSRRGASTVVDLDDEHPDFSALPTARPTEAPTPYGDTNDRERFGAGRFGGRSGGRFGADHDGGGDHDGDALDDGYGARAS